MKEKKKYKFGRRDERLLRDIRPYIQEKYYERLKERLKVNEM